MEYKIKAHKTFYDGVLFRSRLEARWAAFFELAGWKWEYEPIDLDDWVPDFRVEFKCGHSECNGKHILMIEVKPYYNLKDFDGHPCHRYEYGQTVISGEMENLGFDGVGLFGINSFVAQWDISHGAGGGIEEMDFRVDDHESLWKKAGNIVQWNPC